ncbi:MAG TPA: glycosyltransferase [Planctomycetota bacterium]|nr:glycosyltransferase [Planctomycetota bacterium]
MADASVEADVSRLAPGRDAGPGPGWPAGLAALVPVFDHVATVGGVVAGLRAMGAPVLVIDDGSSDGSGAAATAAGGVVVRQAPNAGKGAALARGLRLLADQGFVQALTVDADGQHPLPEAGRLARAAAAEPAALHVGSRDMQRAPRASRFGRRWSDLWVRIACGAWPGDAQSGLRCYPLPITTTLAIGARRYSWEVEVLVRAAWAGVALRPLPVAVLYPADRVSHFRAVADNARTAWTFTRLVTRRCLAACGLARLTPRGR